MKIIEIEHHEDGRATVEVIGVEDGTCTDITKEIEDLHGKVMSREFKSSYYDEKTGVTVDTSQLCG